VLDLIISEANNIQIYSQQDDGFRIKEKLILSIAIRLLAEEYMIKELKKNNTYNPQDYNKEQTYPLFNKYKLEYSQNKDIIKTLNKVILMTPENIHINSFMYEPIIDMSIDHLVKLYSEVKSLT
jgi:hypothetical protein